MANYANSKIIFFSYDERKINNLKKALEELNEIAIKERENVDLYKVSTYFNLPLEEGRGYFEDIAYNELNRKEDLFLLKCQLTSPWCGHLNWLDEFSKEMDIEFAEFCDDGDGELFIRGDAEYDFFTQEYYFDSWCEIDCEFFDTENAMNEKLRKLFPEADVSIDTAESWDDYLRDLEIGALRIIERI